MGLLNIYDTVSNEHSTIKANGKLKNIIPDVAFSHSLVLKAGNRLDGEYEVTEEDVLYIRKVPSAVSATALAWIAVGIAVISIGVGVGAGLYANKKAKEAEDAMEKAQKDAQNLAQQTQQLPYIRGAKNRSALGEQVQFVMGSIYNTPYSLTDGFYSIDGTDGEEYYYNSAFSCGYGSQKITEILLGGESLCKKSAGIDGVNAFDSDSAYYKGNNSRVEVAQPGTSLALCTQKVSSTYSGAEIKHDYGEDAEPVIVQAADNAMTIQVCIQFSALREYDGENSTWKSRSVQVQPYWSNDGGETWNLFTFTGSETIVIPDIFHPGEFTYEYNYFTKNKNKNIRYVATKTFTAAESYGKQILIKVEKTTPKKESNTQEDCALLWYQTFCYDYDKSSSSNLVACSLIEEELLDKTTKVAYRIQADDSTSDYLDELHCMTEGLARTWSGSNWSNGKTSTRNPAAWLLEILTSSVHLPSKFTDSQINLTSFGELYEYCNENQFYCDGIISTSEKKRDIIEKILSICNATLIINNEGLYEVCIDKEEETPVALLNTENIVSFSFSKSLAKKVDGTKVTFTNRDSWTVDTFYSMLDGGSYDYVNDTVDTLAIDYVTEYKHAYKVAQRQLRQRQLQPREIKVNVGHEGDYYPLYSTVLLQLPHLLQGLRSSVIKAVGFNSNLEITKLEISDLVDFLPNTRYGVIIQATNNFGYKLYSAEVVDAEGMGSTRILTLAEPLSVGSETIIPVMGNHLSFGTLDSNGSFTKITNTMKIYGVEPNGKDGFTLSLRDYNEEVYKYTPSGVSIPDYKSNITIPQKKEKTVTLDDLNELRDQMNKAINGILTDAEDIGSPSDVTLLTAVAGEEGIQIKWQAVQYTGLQDAIKHYVVELSKDSGETWTTLPRSAASSVFYTFDRSSDGYPEKDAFNTWSVRVKAENIYGKQSVNWAYATIDTSSYLTWIPSTPVIFSPRINHRTCSLNFGQSAQCYGGVQFFVSIQRYDEYNSEYNIWNKPDLNNDPYSSEYAYKDITATAKIEKDGITYYYLAVASGLTQTLPLERQLANVSLEVHKGSGLLEKLKAIIAPGAIEQEIEVVTDNEGITQSIDTNYYYRVWCYNTTTRRVSNEYAQILITAKATSAYDIVDSAIITNKMADGAVTVDKLAANCVTAEKLYSRNLTTVGAFIGSIYGARLDDNQYIQASEWTADTVYYVYDETTSTYSVAVIQPTAENFNEGTYYIPNKNYGMPSENANSYWKDLETDEPEFRIGNEIDAEMFELKTGKYKTEAEYMHYVPDTRTYNFSYPDPDTGTILTDSVSLPRGIYFKIANFVVTAISSVIKGLMLVQNKILLSNFMEVNPETSTQSGVAAETVNINGDVNIKLKSDDTAGSLTVAGDATIGGNATISGNETISGTETVNGNTTLKGTLAVGTTGSAKQTTMYGKLSVKNSSGSEKASITQAGAISGTSVTSTGGVSADGTVSGSSVTSSGDITASSGTITGSTVKGTSHLIAPSGHSGSYTVGEIWVVTD